ncbi:serine hydrolase FSH [Poronia punctata]|nr:serine hydrolase FSH [Poronia punctata]
MAPTDTTLHHPRILCLHGGGTNARIFRAQCRTLSRALEPHFRLAYAEAPYPSKAGPDVLAVYASEGPFKRWLPWLPEHVAQVRADEELKADQAAARHIDASLRRAMEADDAAGADGPWVAVLGFSQGAKLAASMLHRQQSRAQRRATGQLRDGEDKFDVLYDGWKFAVVLAGRAPIVNLEPEIPKSPMLARPTQLEIHIPDEGPEDGTHILRLPSIHLHGLADPGLNLHRQLYEKYMDPKCTTVLEWDGNHRVVLKTTDVQPLVDAIFQMAMDTKSI